MDSSQFGGESPGEIIVHDGYATFSPDPLPPEIEMSHELAEKLSTARGAVGELAGIGHMVQRSRMLLLRPFIRREAVYSSRIEGTYATVSDVYAHEAGQKGIISHSGRKDVTEVFNYVKATERGIKRTEEEPITTSLIKKLHKILLTDVRGEEKRPGEFRDRQNAIGAKNPVDARYVPPPAHTIQYSLQELVEHIQNDSKYDPLINIALAHYQFETIHPFLDGNGRMGRVLITLMLHKENLLPEPFLYFSSYFNANRDEYVNRLFSVSTKGEWEEWILFFLEGVIDQSKEAFIRARELMNIQQKYRERYQANRSETLLKLIYQLFQNPFITISEAADRLGVSYQTARRSIYELEDDGVLRETTGQDRYQVFEGTEIMEVIEEPIDSLVGDVNEEFENRSNIKGQASLEDFN